MSLPARPQSPPARNGLMASAHLMRALGARGGAIWPELTREEAETLTRAMEALPDNPADAEHAAAAFLNEASSAKETLSVWDRLGAEPAERIAGMVSGEHPQTTALVLSRIPSAKAAQTVRTLSPGEALLALRRMLDLQAPHPRALAALEDAIERKLKAGPTAGDKTVARIFDQLDERYEQAFLTALNDVAPGAKERIRALMFTFDDLAALPPAGIQTLLSRTDRSTLAAALKAAEPATAEAIFANMTQRAGAALRDDIEAAGPRRRADVDAARQALVDTARALLASRDISGDAASDDNDLIE